MGKLKLPFLPIFCSQCGGIRRFGHECENCDNPQPDPLPEPRGSVVRTEHLGYGGLISESDVRKAEK